MDSMFRKSDLISDDSLSYWFFSFDGEGELTEAKAELEKLCQDIRDQILFLSQDYLWFQDHLSPVVCLKPTSEDVELGKFLIQ